MGPRPSTSLANPACARRPPLPGPSQDAICLVAGASITCREFFMAYQHITVPADGQKITVNADHSLNVPDNPIIPFIEGDGIESILRR